MRPISVTELQQIKCRSLVLPYRTVLCGRAVQIPELVGQEYKPFGR